jgi:outer membrane receptor for ferrienterochelin and colicins
MAVGAQEVVQGVVREKVTGHPVSGAQVNALPRGPIAWTDNDGRFRFAVTSRPDSLRIIAIGYAAARLALAGNSVEVTLEPLTVVLPELVSTAGRFEERAAEVTAPVVNIPEAEIAAQAAVATDQIVSQLPGLQSIPSPPAGTSISIRGIGDSRVLVLMDGEPVGGSLLQNIDLSRLSTVAVSRIEVTKGPASAIYGSDALGGVINLVTQGPPQSLQLGLSARTGSFGRLEGYGDAGGTFGKFGFSITGGARAGSGAGHRDRIGSARAYLRCAQQLPLRRKFARGTPRRRDLLLRAPALAPRGRVQRLQRQPGHLRLGRGYARRDRRGVACAGLHRAFRVQVPLGTG